MFVLVSLELSSNIFKGEGPLFLKKVVLLKAGADMSLILFVMLSDLRLSFLENFDFKTTFSGPLLS